LGVGRVAPGVAGDLIGMVACGSIGTVLAGLGGPLGARLMVGAPGVAAPAAGRRGMVGAGAPGVAAPGGGRSGVVGAGAPGATGAPAGRRGMVGAGVAGRGAAEAVGVGTEIGATALARGAVLGGFAEAVALGITTGFGGAIGVGGAIGMEGFGMGGVFSLIRACWCDVWSSWQSSLGLSNPQPEMPRFFWCDFPSFVVPIRQPTCPPIKMPSVRPVLRIFPSGTSK
jgi:hypothetical protein